MSPISWRKLQGLIRKADCAYVYSDGSLYLVTRDTLRGADVTIRTTIKGFVKPWYVMNYDRDNTQRDPRLARIILGSFGDKGCLTVARPVSVEAFVGSCSDKSKPLGIGGVGVRFRYGNGDSIKLEYLSQGHGGNSFGAETWESYLVSAEFTLQTGLDEASHGIGDCNEVFEIESRVEQ